MTTGQIKYLYLLAVKHSGIAPWYLSQVRLIGWLNETLDMQLNERVDLKEVSHEETNRMITQLKLIYKERIKS